MTKPIKPVISFVRTLCSHLGEKEMVEAEGRLAGYMKVVVAICERIEREKHVTSLDK